MLEETKNLETLYQDLHYNFQDEQLINQALTHKSYAHENQNENIPNNERLEFLGDAVLDLIISDLLMERFPLLSEGGLSRIRAGLVSESGLSKIAVSMDLGKYLYIGKGEVLTGGRQKSSILSDALEAVFAAVYLDSRDNYGLDSVREVIVKLFEEHIPKEFGAFNFRDFKTELQEYVQKKFHTVTVYQLVNEEGPDHQKTFEVSVKIMDKEYGRGVGMSKKQAEQSAAEKAIMFFKENENKKDIKH